MNAPDVAGEIQDLVDTLNARDIHASADVSDLNPPCVWVNVDQVDIVRLDGSANLVLTLLLIVPDQGAVRSWEALRVLLDQVLKVVTPTGPITPEGVVLPGDSTPLPALALPRTIPARPVITEGI